jgi:hypothetical protein
MSPRQRSLPGRRRAGTALVLCAYLVSTFGLPLPASSRRKDSHVPFPCQGSACGCQTAEQCWTQCCCWTVEEHWAWARAHHVRPPDYARRPEPKGTDRSDEPAGEWRTTPRREAASANTLAQAGCSCGSDRAEQACTDAVARPCCAKATRAAGCCKDQPSAANAHPSGVSLRWVPGVSALRCQGLTALWSGAAPSLPPPALVTWEVGPDLVTRLPFADESATQVPLVPPVPPPR